MTSGSADGMRDVVAADTSITWIDGSSGQLRYGGYAIGELAEHCSFEQVAALLWHGEIPDSDTLRSLQHRLRTARIERRDVLETVRDIPLSAHPLDGLRFAVCWDALRHPAAWNNEPAANQAKAEEFTAWFPVAVAALHRRRSGAEPVNPRPDLDTAANFLFMLHGREPSDVAVQTLNTSLVLHADHELNASTFAARVTIATQSNMHAAIASALGTLSGPRHGGASELVIKMLREIDTPQRADLWVQEQLKARRRIMGFGHAVYRTIDPRARHLKTMASKLLINTERESWIHVLDVLERVMERERHLYPNVDLYAAVVNHELGIDPAFYSSIFACSRIAGWTAHTIEQLDGRLIRPAAHYIGPEPRTLLTVASR